MRKNCSPHARYHGRTSQSVVLTHSKTRLPKKQPSAPEPMRAPRPSLNRPDGFDCERCGQFTPWRRIGTREPQELCLWCHRHGMRGPASDQRSAGDSPS